LEVPQEVDDELQIDITLRYAVEDAAEPVASGNSDGNGMSDEHKEMEYDEVHHTKEDLSAHREQQWMTERNQYGRYFPATQDRSPSRDPLPGKCFQFCCYAFV